MGETLIAFINVNVVPMDHERVLADHAVVVKNGRIFSVAPVNEIEIPSDCHTINGSGGYLLPGIADMHVHLDMRDSDPAHLVLYLAEGTTTVRSMNGTTQNAEWRDQVVRGELVGPTILTADKTLVGALDPELIARMPFAVPAFTPETTEEAVAEVNRQAAGWADFIKVYDELTEEQYLAAITAAKDAGAYVAGHALDEASLETILKSGIDEIAHLDELNFYHWIGTPDMPDFRFDYEAIPKTATLMRKNDVAVVSNLVADETLFQLIFDSEAVLARPEYRSVRPRIMDIWRTQGRHLNQFAEQGFYRRDVEMPFFRALLQALSRAGVIITVGTDTSPLEGSVPTQIHREIELLIECGLSEFEALSAATRKAGVIVDRMGSDGGFGTVAPGQRADLLLLHDNPLEDVSATKDRVGVMARGVWRTQENLDRMVADFIETY